MDISSVDLVSMRPLDRVLAFVDFNIPPENKREGARLPTTREVSELIDVSPATVRNAYQILAERGLARCDMGSGTYWTAAVEKLASQTEIVVGVNGGRRRVDEVSSLQSNRWGDRIIGGLVRGMFDRGLSLRLKSVNIVQDDGTLGDTVEVGGLLEGINAFVVMPGPTQRALVGLLNERGVPNVCVNPPAISCTSNYVAPDYFGASKVAGMAFAAARRQRACIFLAPDTERSMSCQLRLAGFVSGLHAGEHVPDFRKLVVSADEPQLAREAFARFLEKGWIPDSVYTAGDDMALAVIDVAKAQGIRIPEDMSVIGGNGLPVGQISGHSSLTAMVQPLEQIGQSLAQMLLEKRKQPNVVVPADVLPMRFWIGKTTLPSEDEVLVASCTGGSSEICER